jgi:hypothetical protein
MTQREPQHEGEQFIFLGDSCADVFAVILTRFGDRTYD